MSKVFVTGSTGVLGRRVVPLLLGAGHEVAAVVRSRVKADEVRSAGATPVAIDVFDPNEVRAAIEGCDAIAHLATHIPTGASAVIKRGWRDNDRLRAEASGVLSRAAISAGVERYVQESITFPYVDGGAGWIDESFACTYFWGNRTTVDAERAAESVTAEGGVGVALRFAMFMAADSAHMLTFSQLANRGIWGLFGADDDYVSFVHVDDAASAVVAALDAPAGVYNVAEAEPLVRGRHRAALASAVGRDSLRSIPSMVQRVGGAGAESLARSHRISSQALTDATGWAPRRAAVDTWSELG